MSTEPRARSTEHGARSTEHGARAPARSRLLELVRVGNLFCDLPSFFCSSDPHAVMPILSRFLALSYPAPPVVESGQNVDSLNRLGRARGQAAIIGAHVRRSNTCQIRLKFTLDRGVLAERAYAPSQRAALSAALPTPFSDQRPSTQPTRSPPHWHARQ